MPHEIVNAFAKVNLRLNKTLALMLDNHFSHCTDRRGCGYTQATRFLSDFINQPQSPCETRDLNIFAKWPLSETEQIAKVAVEAGWSSGWRQLEKAPTTILNTLPSTVCLERLCELSPLIDELKSSLYLDESLLFVDFLKNVLTRAASVAPEVAGMPLKPEIGSCSQAEEFFLEIAHARIRRGGKVNIVVADDHTPVMVEKVGLGESHSAVVVSPISIFGVTIPVGSLCALNYDDTTAYSQTTAHGQVIVLSKITQARFLRLTTLAVAPEVRVRAFSPQVDAQVRGQMLSPLTTSIEQLKEFAIAELSSTEPCH